LTAFARAGARLSLCLALAACGGGGGGGGSASPPPPPPVTSIVYASWTSSPQLLGEAPPGAPRPAPALIADKTVRQVAHLSMGGTKLRVKLSNLFGSAPVTFTSVHIARSTGASAIDASTDRAVTFAGSASLTAVPGAEVVSDDIDFPVARGADVAVSIYVAAAAPAETGHASTNGTVYVANGNAVGAATLAGAQAQVTSYWLTEIDASGPQKPSVVVAFGDSITEGTGSTVDANRRYPDQLSTRVAAEASPPISVVNAGIGGNRWVFDFPGPSGANRFEHDVLGVQGVTHAIVLLGINDLELAHAIPTQSVTVDQLTAATQGAIAKAKARGVKVLLGTVTPYKGSALYDPADEMARESYNAWIRSQALADGVVDFDAVLRDPADPTSIAAQYASPDRLHPNDAGYAAMAAAIDVARLR
jgi:lysophospholipase L1-like esterase